MMDKSSILHIPLSEYAFASKEDELTIRIRTGHQQLTKCTLFYGDRACKKSPIDFFELPMKLGWQDETYDYYEITFKTPFCRVCYYFLLENETEWYYYYGNKLKKNLADFQIDSKWIEGRSEYYQYPFIMKEEIQDVPEWFKNAVVYNIFPDSFATTKKKITKQKKTMELDRGLKSNSLNGGTIKGITENLDYIEQMGFDCIYLNPIFTAGEWHKYDILDYYHIDPCFGTDADFKQLIEEIHKRKMHIIIDGVFNHCSWYFFAFQDVVENGEKSKYKDWFYQLEYPVVRPEKEEEIPNYTCFAYERKMPKLNTANEEVQQYFAKIGQYWIEQYGIDGWRLDVANEIDKNFWRQFRMAVKRSKSDCVLIGEVWEDAQVWLRGDLFDSTMNYSFRNLCRDFLALQCIDGNEFSSEFMKMIYRYPKNIADGQMNLINTHDVPRFLSLCENQAETYVQALVLLLTLPGVPSVFYGDELEISGVAELEYRKPMPWEKVGTKLEETIKKLIQIRKKYLNHHIDFQFDNIKKNSIEYTYKAEKYELHVALNRGKQSIILNSMKKQTILLSANMKKLAIEEHGFCVSIQNREKE